jgi:hypothetical protein
VTSPAPSTLAAPTPQAPTVPPLSPPVEAPAASGGGSARANSQAAGTTPGATTSSGLTTPSTPGGGGRTLQDCMGFWDKGTHMTKQQWRAACQRVQSRLEGLKP